jgi:flavin-dependent dehydrogenase
MVAEYDVIILGGGPAGSAAALSLTQAGKVVAVLERTGYETRRLGETLPPSAALLLWRLGVWEAFLRDEHWRSPGIVSVWDDEELYENAFIFNLYGNGWHVDRPRFDAMLATAAEDLGAVVHRGADVLDCSYDAPTGWCVEMESAGRVSCLRATLLIDATGRSSWLARRLGARRLACDRLVCVLGILKPCACVQSDPRLLLEAAEQGWWYSAPLPGDRIAAAYMTDVDLLPKPLLDLSCFWAVQLRQTGLTRRRLMDAAPLNALHILPANSYRMDPVAGESWVAVGDAAMAWDPLSSQGIGKALESALAAAAAIRGALDGQLDALLNYAGGVALSFDQYCRLRTHFYGQVRRWPGSPFWERRQITRHTGLLIETS